MRYELVRSTANYPLFVVALSSTCPYLVASSPTVLVIMYSEKIWNKRALVPLWVAHLIFLLIFIAVLAVSMM